MKLIFAYNASGDFASKSIDFAHKILAPRTYRCDLCALTHGAFKEKLEWSEFKKSFHFEMKFIYKEELDSVIPQYSVEPLPFIVKVNNDQSILMMNKEDLSKLEGVDELINEIRMRTDGAEL